jgi:hypothetical protein
VKLPNSRFCTWLLPIILALSAGEAMAQSYVLDDFEAGTRRIVQPQSTADNLKYLWGLYSNGAGPVSIVTSDAHSGTHALQATQASGTNWQFQLYTYTEFLPGWTNGWKYMRTFVNNPSMVPTGGVPAWPLNKVNRLRFWIKLPPGYSLAFPNHNIEFGTYIRGLSTGENVAESNNQHYYHFFDLRSTGHWEQCIVDTHPDHQRGTSGGIEVPDNPDQVNDPFPGYNYYDMMTRFYIDIPYSAVRGDILVDDFELYQETNPENTAQVRSLHAVYLPETNGIEVGWTRPANQAGIAHEVRYAFTSVHALGWANATVPSNTVVADQGNGGYNGMRWTGTAINLAGHDKIYIAIKPQNSSLFREITVPLSGSSTPTAAIPNPPTSVHVQ